MYLNFRNVLIAAALGVLPIASGAEAVELECYTAEKFPADTVYVAEIKAESNPIPVIKTTIGEPAEPKTVPFDDILRSLAPVDSTTQGLRKRAVDLDIRFAYDSAELLPTAIAQLDALAAALGSGELDDERFLIVGHTDARGKATYNKKLSAGRAETVKRYLVEKGGIAAVRLDTAGHGEERLKDKLDPEGAANRRVEISVIEQPAVSAKPVPKPASTSPRDPFGRNNTNGGSLQDSLRSTAPVKRR